MTTTFDNKVAILAELDVSVGYGHFDEQPEITKFVEMYNIAFPLAVGIQYGFAIATDKGVEAIDQAFGVFLDLLGVEDKGYSELDEFLEVEEDL
jgi:hypothetical protein